MQRPDRQIPLAAPALTLLAMPDADKFGPAVIYVLCLIMCVAVHEFGHAYMADRLGDPLPRAQGRVTLNPIAHIDLIGTVVFPFFMALGVGIPLGWGKPVEWSGHPRYLTRRFSLRTIRLLVSVAGPAMNLLLMLVFSALFLLLMWLAPGARDFALRIVLQVVLMNLGLMFFNLLPIPPLDGRSFLEFLPAPFAPVREALMKYGGLIFLALIFTGAMTYVMLPFRYLTVLYTRGLLALLPGG